MPEPGRRAFAANRTDNQREEAMSREQLESALQGRFLVERELGQGGMGVVYLARDLALDRPVAIKVLREPLAGVPELRRRFLQEARTAARLSHPNVVPVFAVEEHPQLVCFVMAWVPGETLAERVRRDGPLPAPAAARLVQELAWALAYAHQHGIVHRDVKPENVLLERGSGRALLTDFGIARLHDASDTTPAGRTLGTPRMVSPEQAAGEPLDGRSDLYSLGVTAFFAVTGRYPFEAETAAELLAQHLTLPAPPVAVLQPGLPVPLARAIDRCLAKSPEDRFANGEELAVALGGGMEISPVPRTLAQLAREISSLGVDLVGFGTLALVAAIAQQLLRDFLGMGLVYTVGISLVLVSLAMLRGLNLARLTREASREGWTDLDLRAAAEREARAGELRAAPDLRWRVPAYLGGLALLVLVWLGPKQWGLERLEGPVAWLIELFSLAAPVALGRWFGGALEAPRDGRPGLLSRFFLRFKSGMFFRWLGGRRGVAPAVLPDQPTEVLLAEAARDLLKALPAADPERARALDLLGRMERDAALLRGRLDDLDQARALVGPAGSSQRKAVGETLDAARREAADRLGAATAGLESLRLELLRRRAGLAAGGNLTDDLTKLRRLSERIDASLESEPDS